VSDIFREIDEELRRDNLLKLWQRYGFYIIGAAVLIVAITGAIVFWREWQGSQRAAEGSRYAAALEAARSGQDAKAIEDMTAIAREGSSGHALLARFERAALQAKTGDTAGAVASWTSIAEDSSVDPLYRGLATVLAALHLLPTAEPQQIVTKLQPIVGSDSPWRPSGLEVTALAQLKAGDRKGAVDTYKRLADDLAAPPGLRARAAEMITALSG
jgi:hypothetical protein